MPTFETTARFQKDFADLDPTDQARFQAAVRNEFFPDLVESCEAGRLRFRPGLRVKSVRGVPQVLEMTWAPNGRATFEFGHELAEGDPHIIWRRVGTHEVFKSP